MHRRTIPSLDTYSDRYETPPVYDDVVRTVADVLASRARAAIEAGVEAGAIVLDPGLGFGKTVEQNAELIRRTGEIAALGYPVLSGASRKSFVGRLATGRGDSPASDRVGGSIGASLAHLVSGAMIFRVHDVEAQACALRAAWWLLAGPVARVQAQG
jgi:dihydropteroate synthase